ncbi:MAG TPA: hypothetical protein VGM06_08670 [Polyangiaceae bacterium]|jgi:hypothetical protein
MAKASVAVGPLLFVIWVRPFTTDHREADTPEPWAVAANRTAVAFEDWAGPVER